MCQKNNTCCSAEKTSSHHHSTTEPTVQESIPTSDAQYVERWFVSGMDCPSCVKKIETAVNQLDDVVEAKVLFTTEKLVVTFDLVETKDKIEAAVQQAGFTLQYIDATNASGSNTTQAHSTSSHPSDWKNTLLKNKYILMIVFGMVIAFLLRTSFPKVSEGLFIFICLFGLYPIAKQAISLMKSGTPFSIEMLMSVAALGALYLGETVEATMVLLLFLIGEQLEAFAAYKARSGVKSLMELVPETAIKIVDQERVEVSVKELAVGDIIEVSPGDRLPADGILLTQSATFDESALTGESFPVEREEGEQLMAGVIAVDMVVRLTITSKQGENAIDRILHLIEEAESRKAPLERFLDKFSRWYTPLMMLLSLLVIITPPLLLAQPWETWIYRGLALLLIACPCALVISIPAAITSGLAVAAHRGALIKGGAALEQLGKIEIIAFDKTGTLTQGKPAVTDVIALNGWEESHLLSKTAAIEVGSTHPLAVALVKKAESLMLPIPHASEKKAIIGKGISGIIDEKCYQMFTPTQWEHELSDELSQQIEALQQSGKTVVIASEENTIIGLIAWRDMLREDAKAAIDALHQRGIKTLMLTGDNAKSAEIMSQQLGIDFKANLLPQDKVNYIQSLAVHQQVAMVGDGINDAPAMKEASIGIAMGGGTDVALETADAAITHNRLIELANIIELSQMTMLNIRQNISLALGLKAVFLVTSLLGITGLWMAVLADSGATVLVTLNALRLLQYRTKKS